MSHFINYNRKYSRNARARTTLQSSLRKVLVLERFPIDAVYTQSPRRALTLSLTTSIDKISRTRTRARFAFSAPPARLGELDRSGRRRLALARVLARVLGELIVKKYYE